MRVLVRTRVYLYVLEYSEYTYVYHGKSKCTRVLEYHNYTHTEAESLQAQCRRRSLVRTALGRG